MKFEDCIQMMPSRLPKELCGGGKRKEESTCTGWEVEQPRICGHSLNCTPGARTCIFVYGSGYNFRALDEQIGLSVKKKNTGNPGKKSK